MFDSAKTRIKNPMKGVMGAHFAAFDARLKSTGLGRAARVGFAETFGWHFDKAGNQGFLGHRLGPEKTTRSAIFGKMGKNAAYSRAGRVAGMAGRALNPLLAAYFTYQGYREGGVLGAAKELGIQVGFNTGLAYISGKAGVLGAGMIGAGVVGGIAAAGYGIYQLGEAGREHRNKLRTLEMGGRNDMINTAGTATARQRALMALNDTHLNARQTLGNEAALLTRGF